MCSCSQHPTDTLHEVNEKIALIADLTSQFPEDGELSSKGMSGLYWFLREAELAITNVLLSDSKKEATA